MATFIIKYSSDRLNEKRIANLKLSTWSNIIHGA